MQDNLNTHDGTSLYEPFPPAEARRLLDKLAFHYTPKIDGILGQHLPDTSEFSECIPVGTTSPLMGGPSPSSDPAAGGTAVTLRGRDLFRASVVLFGVVPASFQVLTPGLVRATAPRGTPGTVNLQVVTPLGVTPITSATRFTYTAGTGPGEGGGTGKLPDETGVYDPAFAGILPALVGPLAGTPGAATVVPSRRSYATVETVAALPLPARDFRPDAVLAKPRRWQQSENPHRLAGAALRDDADETLLLDLLPASLGVLARDAVEHLLQRVLT